METGLLTYGTPCTVPSPSALPLSSPHSSLSQYGHLRGHEPTPEILWIVKYVWFLETYLVIIWKDNLACWIFNVFSSCSQFELWKVVVNQHLKWQCVMCVRVKIFNCGMPVCNVESSNISEFKFMLKLRSVFLTSNAHSI